MTTDNEQPEHEEAEFDQDEDNLTSSAVIYLRTLEAFRFIKNNAIDSELTDVIDNRLFDALESVVNIFAKPCRQDLDILTLRYALSNALEVALLQAGVEAG